MKTPIGYYGGKQAMLKYILPLVPEHTIYTEAFFGGGAVFFAKEPCKIEVINDINNNVINFYRIAKTNFDELNTLIQGTLHSRADQQKAFKILKDKNACKIEKAWALWCSAILGQSNKLGAGLRHSIVKKEVNRTIDYKTRFTTDLLKRLETTEIENWDALTVIKSRDSKNTFHYIDPPYFNSDMGCYGGYKMFAFEMLLQLCATLKGKFLMSSYQSDILETYKVQNNWNQVSITKPLLHRKNHDGTEKTEVLTANYAIDWMKTAKEVAESIPPAYTEYIGKELIRQLAIAPAVKPQSPPPQKKKYLQTDITEFI